MAKRSKKGRRPADRALNSPATIRETHRAKSKALDWKRLVQVLLIAAAGFWIYQPVLYGDWIWDDDYLISQNELIHSANGLWYIWFSPSDLVDYFPLTSSLEWLEWQCWPNTPFCFHLTNVLLHLCSALLVWRLLSKLGLRQAWLGGLLFAIHPVMVESVAWMAELKNTLSLPPFLLAMCAWIDYDRREKLEDYFLALFLFLIAMLCKSTMVMFPVVILLYAWWKRGRIGWSDLKKSVAFFAVSLVVTLAVLLFLHHGLDESSIPLGGFFSRMACAGLSMAFYFSKSVLPVDLSPVYPQWKINPPELWQFIPWLVLGGAIYYLWTKRAQWERHVLFGLGFFFINLIPFVGLHTISFMRVTWVMDHFLYLPIIGLLGLVVAAWGQVNERLAASVRPYAMACIAVVAALLAFGSHRYAKIFVNSDALWTYEVRRYPDAWFAYNNLGKALLEAGRLPEAKAQFEKALSINPNYPEAHNNLGNLLFYIGRRTEAIEQYEEAIKIDSTYDIARDNLSKVQGFRGTVPATK